ncbi:MAG: SDR family NAD(P)-dependent oxidoreductase [Sulfuritalea sp.]|nr:SDR family NAD(P)-dependent oxidoreductase [Sulfuritalea sp.]
MLLSQRFGAVHLLCNNAGVALTRLVQETRRTDWEWVLGANLWSTIHGINHFLPRLAAQADASHIVNTASAAYNVSKHGIVTLSETLYHELRAEGSRVGVSVLCPAWVKTGINAALRNRPARYGATSAAGKRSRAHEERIASALESGRLSADDMADAVFTAIAEERFYVLPHRRINDALRVHFDDILAARNPSPLW